jgi:hypothetical protein
MTEPAHTNGSPTIVLLHGAFAEDAILEVGGAR